MVKDATIVMAMITTMDQATIMAMRMTINTMVTPIVIQIMIMDHTITG